MGWDSSAAAGFAVSGSGGSSSGGGSGSFLGVSSDQWINGILAGASSLAQGKIDRKALAAQIAANRELLELQLEARREEQERARGYELEDRSYRQGAAGNYRQFAPAGLLALGSDGSAEAAETPRGSGNTNARTGGQAAQIAAGETFNPEDPDSRLYTGRDPADGDPIRRVWPGDPAHVATQNQIAGVNVGTGDGGGGSNGPGAWGGLSPGASGSGGSAGGGAPGINWAGATAIPQSAMIQDAPGGGLLQQAGGAIRDAAGNIINYVRDNPGQIAGTIAAGFGGPIAGIATRAVVNNATGGALGADTPQAGGDFIAGDSSRAGGGTTSRFVDWIRSFFGPK